tara:strand:- start:2170 stop:2343 length:174 start_codon:yes stop_codon:yes gene_type:complete
MPSEGIYQKPAGKKLPCGCDSKCGCNIPKSKTMRPIVKRFTIEGPEYKGNAVLNAQK